MIGNEHGSLKWEGATNLMYLNLDKIVSITDVAVSVYDYPLVNEFMKPKEGIKLNKSCIGTLHTNKMPEFHLKEQCQL